MSTFNQEHDFNDFVIVLSLVMGYFNNYYPTGTRMGMARRILSPCLSSFLEETGRRQPAVHNVRALCAPGRDAAVALSRDSRVDQRKGGLLPGQQSHSSVEHELHHGGLARFAR